MDMAMRIKSMRKEKGLTQEELASKLGLQKSAIAKYEKGRVSNIKKPIIQKMCEIFDCSPSYLLGIRDNPVEQFDNIFPIVEKKLPVLGNVACGKPIEMVEEKELYVQAGTKVKADFVLIAKGDSMQGARIQDGDCVFIRQQDSIENGQIAVVAIGDEATLKRCFFYPQKNMLILKAENPKYEDIVLIGKELEDCRIIGKAIAFQSDVK